jgi:hypothetical protein
MNNDYYFYLRRNKQISFDSIDIPLKITVIIGEIQIELKLIDCLAFIQTWLKPWVPI